MKKTTKYLFVIITFLFALAFFNSCEEKVDEVDKGKLSTIMTAETAEDGLPILHVNEIKNISEYTLVRADSASRTVIDAFSLLRTTISEVCGVQLKPITDYNSASQYEIIIGDTKRTESKEATKGLSEKEYLIKMVDKKIIITGGSDSAIIEAINEFIEFFLIDGKVLVPSGEGLFYSPYYTFDQIYIDGKDISEFKIYSVNMDCAERLRDNIAFIYSGQTVETVADMNEKNGPYIILDASSMDYTAYKAEVKDENLYVSGSYKSCMEFFDYYVKKGDRNVNISESFEGNIDAPVLYDKEQLMSVLDKIYNSNTTIIGQQMSPDAPPSVTLELFESATGKIPSIIGLDLACYGMKLPTATAEDKSQIFCELVEYAEGGGIITVSSHFSNPTGNWGDSAPVRGQLGGREAWDELLTVGSELNTIFTEEVILDGEFLKEFNDLGLSVIWRPLHEINSNWFWYSIAESGKTLEAEYGISLWRYIYDIYAEMGLDQLIWEYSPNYDNGWIDVDYCYPGDE
ncbi:MAG: hypothetical protein IKK94_07460, partial [Clostridia bacterium]|nr:hypothetical protein [Clostridia bacterium]